MANLDIYNKVKEVPQAAKKEIKGGRMSGMTDINPMWRIKTLTEQFGVCGFGWKYEIVSERLEQTGDQIAAFVQINLYICIGGEWSAAIPGTGGNMFVAKERAGLHVSDECFKMALTDAISVACKAIGIGADVYWNETKTKYDDPAPETDGNKLTEKQVGRLFGIAKANGYEVGKVKAKIIAEYKVKDVADLSKAQYDKICASMESNPKKK